MGDTIIIPKHTVIANTIALSDKKIHQKNI